MSKQIDQEVVRQYKVEALLGSGAYGHVWRVEERRTARKFALKKVFGAFRNAIDAQRTYREVSVLRSLKHPNIVRLQKVIKARNKKDLYLVMELMEADLHSLAGSQILTNTHHVYILYQLLAALAFLHSASLIHRDLKPSNLLLDSSCIVKLCDFGLVRSLGAVEGEEPVLSQEVATKWYRAPQLLLGSRSYGRPVDLWSTGCIVVEMLTGKPLFAGDSTLHQLQKIVQFAGPISKEDLQSLDSPVAECLLSQIPQQYPKDILLRFDDQFRPLLRGLLAFNPSKRLTAMQALELRFFDNFRHQINAIQLSNKAILPSIDDNVRLSLQSYRERLYADVDGLQGKRQKISVQGRRKSAPNLGKKITKILPHRELSPHRSQSVGVKNSKYSLLNNKNSNTMTKNLSPVSKYSNNHSKGTRPQFKASSPQEKPKPNLKNQQKNVSAKDILNRFCKDSGLHKRSLRGVEWKGIMRK